MQTTSIRCPRNLFRGYARFESNANPKLSNFPCKIEKVIPTLENASEIDLKEKKINALENKIASSKQPAWKEFDIFDASVYPKVLPFPPKGCDLDPNFILHPSEVQRLMKSITQLMEDSEEKR